MNHTFQLSCESTVDFPFSHAAERDMSVLFYSYTVDGEVYEDDMGRDPEALPRFHQMLKDGKMPATSQINAFRYEEYFDELLQKGDVLHIAFGSGMTPSVKNAQQVAEELREKYPDRKLIVVDSFDEKPHHTPPKYFFEGEHIDRFLYSPPACPKRIESVFA